MNTEDKVLHAMRAMAWQRAKGEMESMLETYYEKHDGDKFKRFSEKLAVFVGEVESEGLQE